MEDDLCILAEIAYKKAHPEIDEDDLFPIEWYKSNNYKVKINLIYEALEKNMLIEQLPNFTLLLETIKE